MNTVADSMRLQAMERLAPGDCCLVVNSSGQLHTFTGKGVADLLQLYCHKPELLKGAAIADKVVGKGAAALMILGGVRAVYAAVISEPALQFFSDAHVDIIYGTVVPNIINRKGDGICPVETLCLPCGSAAECLPLIKNFYS